MSGADGGVPFPFDDAGGEEAAPAGAAAGLVEHGSWEAGQRLQGTRTNPDGPSAGREGAQGGAPGAFDAGEFRLITRLAVGATAEVWLAEVQGHAAADFPSRVVVKRLLPALRIDPTSVERFRAEALLGAALEHENLAGAARSKGRRLERLRGSSARAWGPREAAAFARPHPALRPAEGEPVAGRGRSAQAVRLQVALIPADESATLPVENDSQSRSLWWVVADRSLS